MLLIKQGITFTFVLWLMALNAGCSDSSQPLPTDLVFEFRTELRLVKRGGCITITKTPVYASAQKSPAVDYDMTPQTVIIDEKDFAKIWNQLRAIDFDPLKNLSDSVFEDTPPDMSHSETLRLDIDGRAVVAWERPYKFLVEPLRDPLIEMNNLMRRMHEDRLKKPVIPNRLTLEAALGPPGKAEKCLLKKDGKSTELKYSEEDSPEAGEMKTLRSGKFQKIWAEFMKLGLLNIPTHMTEPTDPAATPEVVYNMSVAVEGVELVRFSAPRKFAGEETFNAVWQKLAGFRQGKK
jgi:hypothetical protein